MWRTLWTEWAPPLDDPVEHAAAAMIRLPRPDEAISGLGFLAWSRSLAGIETVIADLGVFPKISITLDHLIPRQEAEETGLMTVAAGLCNTGRGS
jgi:hypothetical protein